MRFPILAILTIIFSACSNQERAEKFIYIDLNSTIDTLKLYSLTQNTTKIDTLIAQNGVFFINADNFYADIYRLEYDSLNVLDFVYESAENISIVARKNHFSEATTNNPETQILWRTEALQAKLLAAIDTINANFSPADHPANRENAAAKLNKLRLDARHVADSLIANAENSLVAVPILNLGNGSLNIFSTIEDQQLIERIGKNHKESFPQNPLTQQLSYQIATSHEINKFLQHFTPGSDEPLIHFTDKFGENRSSLDFLGEKRIVFYAKDYSPETVAIWQKISNFRFQNYQIIGLIPEEIDRYGKLNTTFGTIKPSAFTTIFEDLKIFAWSVDEEGRVKNFCIPTSADDITNDW